MKKLLILFVFLGLLAFPLTVQAAQDDYPRAEVFGGYQYLHLGGSGTDVNANGWNASLTGNFNKAFGVTGTSAALTRPSVGCPLRFTVTPEGRWLI